MIHDISFATPTWEHEFRSDQFAERFFLYRNPQEWLETVLDSAGFTDQVREATAFFDTADMLVLTVEATERVLRFVCGLLNQQAEQHPADATPPQEAERLEATLRTAPNIYCPKCERPGGWKVDGEVTIDASVAVSPRPGIAIRPQQGGRYLTVGSVSCLSCDFTIDKEFLAVGAEEPENQYVKFFAMIGTLAGGVVQNANTPWLIQ